MVSASSNRPRHRSADFSEPAALRSSLPDTVPSDTGGRDAVLPEAEPASGGLAPGASLFGDAELEQLVLARLASVEQRLHAAISYADRLADDAARHLARAGGKRLRPMLALLAGCFGDGERLQVQDAAVVVELTHLATLYHDDVMDSATLRRGAPAAQEVWGNSVAILTGDLLFARASTIGADLGTDAVRIQAKAFERLCLGQLHETVGPAPGEDPVAHYLQVLSDKTASLIATSAHLGALMAGCGAEIIDPLVRYAEKLGVAFQLADDVIDLSPDSGLTGKTPGTDLREGVDTMPLLLLRELAADGDAEALELIDALAADLSSDEALRDIVARLYAHPVVARTRAEAFTRAQEARAELAALPEGPVRAALEHFATMLVERAA